MKHQSQTMYVVESKNVLHFKIENILLTNTLVTEVPKPSNLEFLPDIFCWCLVFVVVQFCRPKLNERAL